jgi:hypothetical protein
LFVGLFSKVANGNGRAGPSASSVQKYVDMGFSEEMVLRAMKDNGGYLITPSLIIYLGYR